MKNKPKHNTPYRVMTSQVSIRVFLRLKTEAQELDKRLATGNQRLTRRRVQDQKLVRFFVHQRIKPTGITLLA